MSSPCRDLTRCLAWPRGCPGSPIREPRNACCFALRGLCGSTLAMTTSPMIRGIAGGCSFRFARKKVARHDLSFPCMAMFPDDGKGLMHYGGALGNTGRWSHIASVQAPPIQIVFPSPLRDGIPHDRPGFRAPQDFLESRLPEGRGQARPHERGRHDVFLGLDRVALQGFPLLFLNVFTAARRR